ncbi:hypothetical protein M4I21_07020 [Cellulophaga sp. 20_2_10]|uniref:hypothetical protein n=1 Tax=Cellulophaga sp. 20_2_10 TaxID=2942476 RepID=UPI00201AE4FA|nr:hypothetical protein [Cellulophaga sp. 20_2_10]MCL5245552.1 hypothetical protein [Cellulophaga sp. 20_2_10]
MTFNYPDSTTLLASVEGKKLYTNLVVQLQKDFGLANIEFSLLDDNTSIAPQDLVAALREKIYQLLLERFTEYLNLLYIIDVPEQIFRKIKATDAVDVADQVAFLILKREWQKVWYKNEYSSE